MLGVSAAFVCVHNALKAHAKVYHLYDKKYRPTQHGKLGIVALCPGLFPKNPNATLAVEKNFEVGCGWLYHPIYVGDYSQVIRNEITKLNNTAHFPALRDLQFSPEWIEYIK